MVSTHLLNAQTPSNTVGKLLDKFPETALAIDQGNACRAKKRPGRHIRPREAANHQGAQSVACSCLLAHPDSSFGSESVDSTTDFGHGRGVSHSISYKGAFWRNQPVPGGSHGGLRGMQSRGTSTAYPDYHLRGSIFMARLHLA